jgi:hypothetical protein
MAKITKPQLQFINPERNPQYDERVFHLFPQLTTELRLKIWLFAMRRQRIINIFLQRGQEEVIDDSPTGTGTSKWDWTEILSSDPNPPYGIFVEGYQLISKFLRVSRESRQEALRFHRVHIPCRLMSKPQRLGGNIMNPEETRLGILYFNPEYDFLHVSSVFPPQARTGVFFFDFVHQLKTTYDPRHVGVLNLALNFNDIEQLSDDNLSVPSGTFLAAINQLHEFFLLCYQGVGRVNLGLLTGADDSDVHFTRSFPLMPLTPAFTRLERDPRPVTEDLKKLNILDHRDHFSRWLSSIRKWGVTSSNQTRYKFLVAHDFWKVHDCATAEIALEREDGWWKNPDYGKHLKLYEKEDMEKAVKPVFGFWLFPIEAFGPYTKYGEPVNWDERRLLRNLSTYYPELGLSILPQDCPNIPGYCPHYDVKRVRREGKSVCEICEC